MRNVLFLFPLLVLLSLPGCAGKQPSPGVPLACYDAPTLTVECFDALYARYSPLLRASTQISVGLYLARYPERTQPMFYVVARIRQRIGQTELTTLAQLEGIARDNIDWSGLGPAVRMGVETLLTAVRVGLEALLADLRVQEPAHVRVISSDVVNWIHQSVLVSCEACLKQPSIRRGVL